MAISPNCHCETIPPQAEGEAIRHPYVIASHPDLSGGVAISVISVIEVKKIDMRLLFRLYVIAALVAAGILAPLVYAPVPWLMLLAYLYLEFSPSQKERTQLMVPLNMALALSLPLFFQPLLGIWLSPMLALPVLPLLNHSLRQFASGYELEAVARRPSPLRGEGKGEGERNEESTSGRRRLTRLARSLALSLMLVALVALALDSNALLFSVALVAAYLTVLVVLALRRASPHSPFPIAAEVVRQRIVAGDFIQTPVKLINRMNLAGHLGLFSPYPWFSIRPSRIVLNKPVLSNVEGSTAEGGAIHPVRPEPVEGLTYEIEASLTPPLAGPARIELAAGFIDPWGLIRYDFTLAVLELLVIPRARYAEWMARKYLETSRGGSQEAVTPMVIGASNRRASRRGIEFYGLRPYQPGDSARTIDWKHTSKLHQMIVKEFLDTTVESAVLAVNLSVTNEEEKDRVVSDLITTALTLARENIPSALAAYNHREVVRTTRLLDPRQALIAALGLTRELEISLSPRRYLAVPDVGRLRANINRLKQSRLAGTNRLAELLQMEYTALGETARQNPATGALAAVMAGLKGKVNVLVVSARNHDAAALAFNRHILEGKGYRFLV